MHVFDHFNALHTKLLEGKSEVPIVKDLSECANDDSVKATLEANGFKPYAVTDIHGRRGIVFCGKNDPAFRRNIACVFERYRGMECPPIVCYYGEMIDSEDFAFKASFLVEPSVDCYWRDSSHTDDKIDDRDVHATFESMVA